MGSHYSRPGMGTNMRRTMRAMSQARMNRPTIGMDAVDLQSIGARLVIYGDINDKFMNYMNPCLEFDGKKKLKIAVRSCNFTTIKHGDWKFLDGRIYSKTEVLYGDLNPDTLEVSKLKKLELSENTPMHTKIAGLEDVRLFYRKDGLHAVGFEVDRITKHYYKNAGMAEYLIKSGELVYLRTLEKPEAKRVEKNWQPTNVESDKFDFTYSPTQTWKNGKVTGKLYLGEIHGGSQLIKQDDGTYLSLLHEKIADKHYGKVYDKYVYLTYLAKHDEEGKVVKLSKPFRFGTGDNIEFASGMVEYKDDFIITLGIRDCKFAIAKINKSKLMSLFDAGQEGV